MTCHFGRSNGQESVQLVEQISKKPIFSAHKNTERIEGRHSGSHICLLRPAPPSSSRHCLSTFFIREAKTALAGAPMDWNGKLSERRRPRWVEREGAGAGPVQYRGHRSGPFSSTRGTAHRQGGRLICSCSSKLCCAVFLVTFQDKHILWNWESETPSRWFYGPKEVNFPCVFLQAMIYCELSILVNNL